MFEYLSPFIVKLSDWTSVLERACKLRWAISFLSPVSFLTFESAWGGKKNAKWRLYSEVDGSKNQMRRHKAVKNMAACWCLCRLSLGLETYHWIQHQLNSCLYGRRNSGLREAVCCYWNRETFRWLYNNTLENTFKDLQEKKTKKKLSWKSIYSFIVCLCVYTSMSAGKQQFRLDWKHQRGHWRLVLSFLTAI